MGIDPVTHSPRLDLLDLSSILSSQMSHVSRLFGAHHQHALVNPELLKLATSLMSNNNITNSQQSQFYYPQDHTQLSDCHVTPVLQTADQSMMFRDQSLETYPTLDATSLINSPSSQITEWQSCNNNAVITNNEDHYVPVLPSYNYDCRDQSFSFPATSSVLSTPSSSPTTALNSNSTTATTYFEDEPESYCSEILKFELSDILDNNYYDQFM